MFTVISQPRKAFGIAHKAITCSLLIGSVITTVVVWSDSSWPLRIGLLIGTAAFASQTLRSFSKVEINEDFVALRYPFMTYRYEPQQVLSIEWPEAPSVIRIRPRSRRFMAYVLYPKSLANSDEVVKALHTFADKHGIPKAPPRN